MLNTPKQQVSFLGITLFLSVFSLASVVVFTDPYETSYLSKIIFYLSLYLASLTSLTLAGLLTRQIMTPKLFVLNFRASLRQGGLAAILVTLSFLLLSFRLLFWWVELSLILFFACIEMLMNLKI